MNINMGSVYGYFWINPDTSQPPNVYTYPKLISSKFLTNTDMRTNDSENMNTVPQANPIEFTKASDKQLTDYLNEKLKSYNYYKRNVYNKFEPVLLEAKNVSAEDPVKEKIYNYATYTLKEVNSKLDLIQALQRMYREYPMFKLGYMISYINKTYTDMEDVFKRIEVNKDKFDLLTLVNSYEHVSQYSC
ncbi:unnamed protein product [Diatraea saccharalis]|uniref:Uncharacterized protein n=1 Tax=Diatraea saccharalis TaxID=40085 RepID=A0A9N9R773_9NEOP|nr:unnamed protein product [Diatraea saccharalis]